MLAAVAGVSHEPAKVDTSLANTVAPAPAPTAPTVPLAGQAPGQAAPATSNEANPVENQPAVPLAQ